MLPMFCNFSRIRSALVLLALVCMVDPLLAQTAFPQQTIKLILPFPPGSGTDGTARVRANEISVATGQAVVVENRAGANGFLAPEAVAKAAPDGYTLLFTSNTHIANKFLFKKLPYDPIQDFKSITLLKEAPLVLVVGANSPFKTLDDLSKKVKQSPGAVSFGSGNSSSRVAAELYSQSIGSTMLYVPYKGNPAALADLLGGRIDLMFSDTTSVMQLIKTGKVRALATTSMVRMNGLKDVPTTAELGLPQVNFGSWLAVMAPARTPDPVVEKLNMLFRSALQSDNVQKNFAVNDSEPKGTTRAELDKFLAAELSKWGEIITKAGIQPE
jgi:tripartite-type tricarboxylate transporter receptor subunit TctC